MHLLLLWHSISSRLSINWLIVHRLRLSVLHRLLLHLLPIHILGSAVLKIVLPLIIVLLTVVLIVSTILLIFSLHRRFPCLFSIRLIIALRLLLSALSVLALISLVRASSFFATFSAPVVLLAFLSARNFADVGELFPFLDRFEHLVAIDNRGVLR